MANSFLDEALARIQADGLLIDNPIADGNLHRCPTQDKPHAKNGAYIIHDDEYPLVWWQNWSADIKETWQGKNTAELSKKERQEYARRMKELARQAEEERKQRHEEAAKEARKIWEAGQPAPETQGYLKRKQVKPYLCRINHRGNLLVPIHDPDGQLVNLQIVLPLRPGGSGGEKRYLPGGRKKDCYCPIPGPEDKPLLIAEGYATAASLHEATGYEVWIAFDCHNLLSVSRLARARFPERKIGICADNDRPHLPNYPEQGGIGAHLGRKATEAIGGYFILCPLYEGHDKADFNDLACDLGLDCVRHEIETVLKGKPVTDCPMPQGFYMVEEGKNAGLFYTQAKPDGTSEDIRLGPPLKVLAYTRTGEGDNWGLMLQWHDADKRQHDWPMSLSLLNSTKAEWFTILIDGGWLGNPAYRKHIATFLASVKPVRRIRCVTATGWHNDRYALPDETFGNGEDELVLQSFQHDGLYQTAGTLESWQELAALCVGNPKLGFAVSCAFAGPMLALAGMEGGLFSFEGASSCGKTTALTAAASVWGKPEFHVKKWRATDNSLEVTASLHNDGLLILDELGEADSKKLAETVYMLSGGQGKNRANKDGGLRKTYRWRVLTLSSGELGLADKLLEVGKRTRAGQEARFVAIPVTTADIANLHDMANSGLLVRQIRKLSETHYGVAGREFLKKLTQEEALQAAKSVLQDGLEDIADSFCPADCDGQVRRVALRFALVSIAGTLARDMGILPADFEAADYARTCFREWLEQRGGIGPAEDMAILKQVRLFIEQHGQSRFQDLKNLDVACLNRAGYREDATFFCLPEAFKAEIVKGYSVKRAIEALAKAGLLQKDAGRSTRVIRVPNLGTVRVYKVVLPEEKSADEAPKSKA